MEINTTNVEVGYSLLVGAGLLIYFGFLFWLAIKVDETMRVNGEIVFFLGILIPLMITGLTLIIWK